MESTVHSLVDAVRSLTEGSLYGSLVELTVIDKLSFAVSLAVFHCKMQSTQDRITWAADRRWGGGGQLMSRGDAIRDVG